MVFGLKPVCCLYASPSRAALARLAEYPLNGRPEPVIRLYGDHAGRGDLTQQVTAPDADAPRDPILSTNGPSGKPGTIQRSRYYTVVSRRDSSAETIDWAVKETYPCAQSAAT